MLFFPLSWIIVITDRSMEWSVSSRIIQSLADQFVLNEEGEDGSLSNS